MKWDEIKNAISKKIQKYEVINKDGEKFFVRLVDDTTYGIFVISKGKRYRGHTISLWADKYDEWKSLKLVSPNVDVFKRFVKRAKKAVQMLENSGLWCDIKKEIEYFLSLSEDVQKEMVNDIISDSYENFYLKRSKGDKYEWVSSYQIFESFAVNRCWKSINYEPWDREFMNKRVNESIKNGKNFHYKWNKGYDNSIDVQIDGEGMKRGWYSEEYVGCANGHYYLLFDATHAIFYEDD